jgi:hypothetical protein
MERFPIYKGLEQPLSYKGLKGKFIGWGIGSLASGIFFGGLIGALTSMYLGLLLSIILSGSLFSYTLHRQKGGLHNKAKTAGLFIHPNKLRL